MITVGVDLGGTNLRAALVGEKGALLTTRKERLSTRLPKLVLEAMVKMVEAAAEDAGLGVDAVAALCVAVAGQVNRKSGIVVVGPNLGWRDVPFGEMLTAAFPFPVRVENDLSAAAWGERQAGAGRGADNLALVAVGSGVGAGLIEGGRLVEGASGLAGELGHIKVVPGGERCGCGELGCLEAYAGGHRMTARVLHLWAAAGETRPQGVDPSEVTMRTVHQAFEGGDQVAMRVLEEAGDHLGLAVANLVTVLNPSRVILGGGVLLGVPYLVERVRGAVDSFTSRSARDQVSVDLSALADDAGLVGAGHLARDFARRP